MSATPRSWQASKPMKVADYKALYEAVEHMSFDIEDNVPRFYEEEWDSESAIKYAYVRAMLDCINDVPRSKVEYALEKGIILPEID